MILSVKSETIITSVNGEVRWSDNVMKLSALGWPTSLGFVLMMVQGPVLLATDREWVVLFLLLLYIIIFCLSCLLIVYPIFPFSLPSILEVA